MKVGIKFGPSTWESILRQYYPECCEIWFRVDWVDRYKKMFSNLQQEKIPTGLHFWGVLPGGILPNFVFSDKEVLKQSIVLVKKTVEIATDHGFSYVNIHPGSYRLTRIDFDRSFMANIPGKETSLEEGNKILVESIHNIHEYAVKNGILLFTETVPSREPEHWRNLQIGRKQTHNSLNVPVKTMEMLAKKGFYICNDFCHTTSDVISNNHNYLFQQLFNKTKRLAPQTKLIHANTMLPPFNGTDAHFGLRKSDFRKKDIFPSRIQYKQLLSLFKDREDVWVIPEPLSHHVENSQALVCLLEEVGK